MSNENSIKEIEDKLTNLLKKKFISKKIIIKTIEIDQSECKADIVANYISKALEKRVPFRRAIKNAISKARTSNIKGIKVQVSGRLNGAEIARTEWIREGRVPLHTISAAIDYSSIKAHVDNV